MDSSSYILLSQQQTLRRQMDITANNMANTSTVGFKREQAVFHEYVKRTEDGAVPDANGLSFVLDYRAIHDTSAGAFQPTGNPLDVMIDGPGYLAVELDGGETGYTRAGFVKISEAGDLVTSGGQRLLDEEGEAINVPPDLAGQLTIAPDGSISGPGGGAFGRLAVTVFDDESGVSPLGGGLFGAEDGRVLAAGETKFRTGGVEGSNVEPVAETTSMIEIMRSYQSSMRMVESLNEMRQRALDRLGRIG